ncbi:MAG: glycoside hydrolase [Hyphomonadaceae bacterium]|nr:glycoside hydrolase [Clostridia bacterium]
MTIIIIFATLCYFGRIWPNNFFANRYAIHGVDVSNHQKNIDWKRIAENKKIQFAFIKATEGKDYKDQYFQANWDASSKAGLYKGAYHYFTTSSSGKEQAENFINFVPVERDCLPPVIDIEERGLDKQSFQKELRDFITVIEDTYHQKPFLYVVYPLYDAYLLGDFEQYPIWIRDIVKPPTLSDKRKWLFWQYCDRGRVEGVRDDVDLNVFAGDMNQFKSLLSK